MTAPADGSTLPFPRTPSASTAGYSLAESVHKRRVEPRRLPEDAPNILIVLLDDVGFGLSDVVGGEVHTPAFARVAKNGVSYNAFHTTSICSPTRAALLTGRNHHRVHSGTIAERAVDWDGYTGVIGKDTAIVAEVLQRYGYKTSAFGKWHNSPATQTTAMGPFDRWPTGHGFDHFYGFIAGETSQWEPRLYENLNPVEPPRDEGYHLSEDLADKAITWLRKHEAFAPEAPFFMYWAPGAAHGPHHIFKDWADKYKGRFDDGWDCYRGRVFARQKEKGWIPAEAELTPRADTMQAWDDVPEAQRPFQRRLMEVFAGFLEHVDVQVGRMLDELDRLGKTENTLVIYIFGDNGSSAEGQKGSISELLAQNNIPNTVEEQLAALDKLGGLDALGSPHTDNMYHAGWAWAGSTPLHHTKLVASHFGGTRNPMAAAWPRRIRPDDRVRGQFHHVNDIVPTLYDILGITPPKVVDGHEQKPLDGVSLAYTFEKPDEPTRKTVQYFERRLDYPDARVHRAGPGPPEQPCPDRARDTREGQRRAVCFGRFLRRTDLVHGQGGAGRRVQHVGHRALPGEERGADRRGLARDRGGDDVRNRQADVAGQGRLKVDGKEVGAVVVARTVPAAFTASETFGVGVDLGSPVSPDYFDRAPFRFAGKIERVDVEVF